jgi:hypothetical protein
MEANSHRKYFSKPLISESLQLLPLALDYPESSAFQEILRKKLPQNSDVTRERYARYIANRYSVNGKMNLYLARFIKIFGIGTSSKEVLFFEMLKAEPVLMSVLADFFSPNKGQICANDQMDGFLSKIVPGKKIKEVRGAIYQVLISFNKLARKKPGEYLVKVSTPGLPEMLYILHRLFTEVGMHRADQFISSKDVAALLWNESQLKELLYMAWHKGYLAKVTEIDRFFHFSTKYTLDQLLSVLEDEMKDFRKSVR